MRAEIHKPKPMHSWRDFAEEIGTIVIGILIAIVLEQVTENIHWASQVRTARRREIAFDEGYFRDRLAPAPCVARHLQQTASLIQKASEKGRLPRVEGVALSLGRRIDTSVRQSQQAAQALVHFSPSQLAKFSAYYTQTLDIESWRNEER